MSDTENVNPLAAAAGAEAEVEPNIGSDTASAEPVGTPVASTAELEAEGQGNMLSEDNNVPQPDVEKDEPNTSWPINTFGNPELWVRLYSYSHADNLHDCTEAMAVRGGCLVRTTSQHYAGEGDVVACSEALVFVPNVHIRTNDEGHCYLGQ